MMMLFRRLEGKTKQSFFLLEMTINISAYSNKRSLKRLEKMMYVVLYYKNTALSTQKIISNNIYSRSTTGFTKTHRKLRFNKEFTSTLSTRKGDL